MITLLLVLHRMYSVKTEYTYTTSVAEPEVEMSQQTNANSSSSQCNAAKLFIEPQRASDYILKS